jgi:hypothetical protein
MTKETEPRVLSDAELDQVHGGAKQDLGNSDNFKLYKDDDKHWFKMVKH